MHPNLSNYILQTWEIGKVNKKCEDKSTSVHAQVREIS